MLVYNTLMHGLGGCFIANYVCIIQESFMKCPFYFTWYLYDTIHAIVPSTLLSSPSLNDLRFIMSSS